VAYKCPSKKKYLNLDPFQAGGILENFSVVPWAYPIIYKPQIVFEILGQDQMLLR